MRSDLISKVLKYWLRTFITLTEAERHVNSLVEEQDQTVPLGTTEDCSDIDVNEADLQEFMDQGSQASGPETTLQ